MNIPQELTCNNPMSLQIVDSFMEHIVDPPDKVACLLTTSDPGTANTIQLLLSFLEQASVPWRSRHDEWRIQTLVHTHLGTFENVQTSPQTPWRHDHKSTIYTCGVKNAVIKLEATYYNQTQIRQPELCQPTKVEIILQKKFIIGSNGPFENIEYSYIVSRRWVGTDIKSAEKSMIDEEADSTFIEISVRPSKNAENAEISYLILSVLLKMSDLLCFLGKGRYIRELTHQ
jgi:hypothetical protein